MRDLAAEFPNISQVYELPKQTWGYQRPAATMLGYQQRVHVTLTPYVDRRHGLPVAGHGRPTTPATAPQQAGTVVVTSKAMGHSAATR